MSYTALWLDDNIDSYTNIVRLLESADVAVTPASTIAAAREAVDASAFDVCIVDIKLAEEDGKDGVDFIREIARRKRVQSFVVLSAHLHKQDFKQRVSKLRIAAGVLEKDFSGELERVEETFLKPIRKWAEARPELQPAEFYEQADKALNDDPLEISFKDFSKLPEFVRSRLVDRVRIDARKAIEAAFKKGAVWVLICGNGDRAKRTANSLKEIPTEEEVLRIARAENRSFFEFSSDVGVDMMSVSEACNSSDSSALATFPTVSVAFDNDDEGRDIHFDTGCPVTFFDYDAMVDEGIIKPSTRSINGRRKETDGIYTFVTGRFGFILRSQNGDDVNEPVEIPVQFVKDWWNSPFSARCDQGCSSGIVQGKRMFCRARCGLMGRDLIVDGGVDVTVLGRTAKTLISRRS